MLVRWTLTRLDIAMIKKIILLMFLIAICQPSHAGLVVKGLYTSGLAYNTTSVPGTDPPDDPLPNGSNCFLNSQCLSEYCSPQNLCADEPEPPDPGNYTIVLTVGDSHVFGQLNGATGQNYPFGFRKRLQQEMLPVVVNMVGNRKINPTSSATFDVDHAGVGGETTAQINARVPNLISNYLSPTTCANTVVVLEGGYNGLTTTEPAMSQQIQELVIAIQRFHAFCPDMPVIFMNLKPHATNVPAVSRDRIPIYNAALLTVMSDLQETIPNLWIWDRYATYNDPANCGGDPDNCCYQICSLCDANCENCTGGTSHPSPTGYELDGHYLGLIIKNGCLSQYDCRANPIP